MFRCWLEDYEVSENTHSRSVSHIRDTTGDYNHEDAAGGDGAPEASEPGKGKGKGKTKNKGGTSGGVKPKPEKKEKTEDQLARAALW